jgi:dsRNA-specific ribonuclease
VEVFSDTMSALVAGIFFDSGDFQIMQELISVLMKSQIYNERNPFIDEERMKVNEVWASKKYTEGLEITHVVEEKNDFIYIRVYLGKLEVRRCKFEKQKVNKVSKTYLDLRFYLENAYK